MTTFTYERVIYNNVRGWFATRTINGGYAGRQFGKTKKAARESFDAHDEDYVPQWAKAWFSGRA